MGELAGKAALVTGAAHGLGCAIAEVFLREGAELLLTDVLVEEGEALAQRLGAGVSFLRQDVTREADWAGAMAAADAAFGRLDILVNNAGLAGVYPLRQTTPELWARLQDVMSTGPYLGMRAALPRMAAARSGAVVNVASTNALQGMAHSAAYTAAKHGVLGATRALALEYASTGVRINAVCPGAMRTPMLREGLGADIEGFAQAVPMGRLADPREVAEVVSFVASPRASFMTGAAVVADGGMTAG